MITDISIRLADSSNKCLKAHATMTLDNSFIVKDIRIIQGKEHFFVGMPSRKVTDRCHRCSASNTLQSLYCHMCGCELSLNRGVADNTGRVRFNVDVAHPINSRTRKMMEDKIIEAYLLELEDCKRIEAAYERSA